MKGAAEKKESDFVETLHYLGASQYEQVKNRAAADTFLKAVSLRGEDRDLLRWLSKTFSQWADLLQAANHLAEADLLMRRALVIFSELEGRTGHESPYLQAVLENYRQLLQDMGKSDAEIDETLESLDSFAQ